MSQLSLREAKQYVRDHLVSGRCVVEPPYVIAIAEMEIPQCKRLVEKGLAICSPSDKWDEIRGRQIAHGRAIAQLARRVMRFDLELDKDDA